MNTETLTRNPVGKAVTRLQGRAMESRFRYRFFGAEKVLPGVDGLQGKRVLEFGCGRGFFTLPAARLFGEQGQLVAMNIPPESGE